MRRLGLTARQQVSDREDSALQEAAAWDLVEMYGRTYTGWLLLDQAADDPARVPATTRYVTDSLARARSRAEAISLGLFADAGRASELLR